MPGVKRLRSVANTFAQHALSGLCYDAPERTLEQRREMAPSVSVTIFGSPAEGSALNAKFAELIAKEGIAPSFLQSAHADFLFYGQCRTAGRCVVTIRTSDGEVISGAAGESM